MSWLKDFFEDEVVKQFLRTILVAVLVCILGLCGYDVILDPRGAWGGGPEWPGSPGGPRPDMAGTSHFSNLYAQDIEAADDLTVGDDAVVAGYIRVSASTTFSVTDGGTITPTGSYMPLESAGAVGCGDIITGTAGDRLTLINTCANTITISDTASLKLGSNRALAQYDSLELWSDGTYWIDTGYNENAGSGTTTFTNLSTTDLAVGDDLTVTDDAVIGGLQRISGQTAISCTNGGTITPTGSYQPLESATFVGLSSIAIGTAGDLLVMVNTVAYTITITDTGTTMLGGNRVLGQYDSLLLWCDGTNWIELSYVDN